MRIFFGIVLIVVPILFFLFALAVAPMGGGGPQAGSLTFFGLCVFGVPVTLGVYLLGGGSRIDKATHLKFGVAMLLLLMMAGGTALSSPEDFDLDVALKYLLIFGGVAFGILGLGYLRASE
jgi:hypothetical protein